MATNRKKSSKESPTSKKARNYFLNFVSTELFCDGLKILRGKYSIPRNGFKKPDIKYFKSRSVFYAPEKWIYAKDNKKSMMLDIEYKELLRPFELGLDHFWASVFRLYLFHNGIPTKLLLLVSKDIAFIDGQSDICDVENISIGLLDKELAFERSGYIQHLTAKARTHPLAIFLSSGATQNDIRAFIDNHWSLVAEQQELTDAIVLKDHDFLRTSGPHLRESKTRVMRARDAYIYTLSKKNISRREMSHKVLKKFGGNILDENYISTIVRREEKRQQEV